MFTFLLSMGGQEVLDKYTLDDFDNFLPEIEEEQEGAPKKDKIQTKKSDDWISKALQGVKEGERNGTAIKLAGFFSNKLGLEAIRGILTNWNERNRPPLQKKEIDDVVKSISKYAQAKEVEQVDVEQCLESWDYIRRLEIETEWIIDKIIPKESVTVIFGKGGIGKTWLALDMAKCIGSRVSFFGYMTKRTKVIFIDFENPLAVVSKRVKQLGGTSDSDDVRFWRANNPKLKPPKLDSENWELLKKLPKESVLIFDTLRAAHNKNENSSEEIGLIMERLKELRDMGFTVIILHHTPKNSDRISKGSTVIVDLADHVLGFTKIKKRVDGKEVISDDDDDDENVVYRLGFTEKTRFEPHRIYLTLNPDIGFELAPDPQEDNLKAMNKILVNLKKANKTDFLKKCNEKTKLSSNKLRKLFGVGEGRFWKIKKRRGLKNAQIVYPIAQSSSFSKTIGDKKLKNSRNSVEKRRPKRKKLIN